MPNEDMFRAAAAHEARGDFTQAECLRQAAENFEPNEGSRALLRAVARTVVEEYDRNLSGLPGRRPVID